MDEFFNHFYRAGIEDNKKLDFHSVCLKSPIVIKKCLSKNRKDRTK